MSRHLKKFTSKKTKIVKNKSKKLKFLFLFGGALFIILGTFIFLQQKKINVPTERYSISDQGIIQKVTTEKEHWKSKSAGEVIQKKITGEESNLLHEDAFNDWMVYEDSVQGFSFLYPQGFEIESTQPDIVLRLMKNKSTLTVIRNEQKVSVSVQDNNASEIEKNVLQLAADGIEETFETFTPININSNAARFESK